MPAERRRFSRFILAPAFSIAALLHAVAIVWPAALEPSPAWRHALFVLINGVFALGFWLRARWLIPAFALLCVQQLYSHGRFALELWSHEHRVDAASCVVLLGLPVAFALVLRER